MTTKRKSNEVYWIGNRTRKTVETLDRKAFPCFEMVSTCFHVGFLMRDGHSADCIGRSRNTERFTVCARHDGFTIL